MDGVVSGSDPAFNMAASSAPAALSRPPPTTSDHPQNLGNARSSALPPSPVGLPSADSVCEIGPTAIVLDVTTMPISESVPCQAVAARAPDKRPAE